MTKLTLVLGTFKLMTLLKNSCVHYHQYAECTKVEKFENAKNFFLKIALGFVGDFLPQSSARMRIVLDTVSTLLYKDAKVLGRNDAKASGYLVIDTFERCACVETCTTYYLLGFPTDDRLMR